MEAKRRASSPHAARPYPAVTSAFLLQLRLGLAGIDAAAGQPSRLAQVVEPQQRQAARLLLGAIETQVYTVSGVHLLRFGKTACRRRGAQAPDAGEWPGLIATGAERGT
jgi:hypothetical protein